MHTVRRIVLALIVQAATLIALCAAAQAQYNPGDPNPLRFGTDDVYLNISPFLQMDGGINSSSPDSLVPSDEGTDGDIRRARIYTDFGYYDLGGLLTLDFTTIEHNPIIFGFLTYDVTKDWTVIAGQQDVPFSMQDLNGSRSALFNEFAEIATLQTPNLLGATATRGDDNSSFAIGGYGGNINGQPFANGYTFATRATYAPINTDETSVHFGLAARGTFNQADPFSFSGSAGSNLVTRSPISAGSLIEGNNQYIAGNSEFAVTSGRFTSMNEFTVGRTGTDNDATLFGGYASFLGFLTDDHRDYAASSGTFNQVTPNHPLDKGGYGAFELGARFDYLNLSDAGSDAGTEVAGTAIANWYLTKIARLSASNTYTHITDGPNEDGDVNTVLLRLWLVY